ncbi:metalloprotease TldD [Roseibium polysiphoniae]|uniref:Metalloprotease TldD n=1 Tax=Roseibium polysiphoniae TaxID=2571221 RepID=A0A944CF18_9HYPH|nr:metalloprotease TldD [Roseibium polysiphoniae]MBS8261377.1 metalloprotease TldD [Roseibium polysiphoniae]
MSDKNTDLIETSGLGLETAKRITAQALEGADDGELFVEYRQSEGLVFDNGRLKGANYDTAQGFGLRAVVGEAAGYAHAGEISEGALKRAADAVSAVKTGHSGTYASAPARTNQSLYTDENPLGGPSFEDKVKLLQEIDAFARARDPRVRQVTASLAGSWQVVDILRADGHRVRDVRPMVRMSINVVAGNDERQESGSFGCGGREGFARFITAENWQSGVDEALRQALVNLDAVPAPAGTLDVVLGPGWPGILLHEAVGHGLEGDFNRKKTSAFAGLMGQRVAAPGVTIVDDGTIPDRRGSLTVDDEGTPAARTTLIEDGILTGYMQDRQNARLMGMEPTGNGRRQSYAHIPMPRMTNTVMMSGDKEPDEILESVKDGLYAVSFGGGQVDITSGKFVFSCTEAYRVRDGKVGEPVKGAMLIGNGPDALTRISMIGNDMALDPGMGTCGKQGQGVPVGVGQPSMRINGLTVGGTAV